MTHSYSQKVSVCIPTYNYSRFIADSIESVLAQTFTDFELIIVDNCSEDDTREVVAPFLQRDNRVTYICNETNVGMVNNWNKCLELAKGEYIKLLCADDTLESECLEKQVSVLDLHSTASMTSCSRFITDKSLRVLKTLSFCHKTATMSGHKLINFCLKNGNMVGEPPAVLFRSNKATRGFLQTYRQITDLEMWLHLLEQGDLVVQPQPLCKIRQHDEQMTIANNNNLPIDENLFLYLDYLEKPYISKCNKYRLLYRISVLLHTFNYDQTSHPSLHNRATLYRLLYGAFKLKNFLSHLLCIRSNNTSGF
ncbi:MAG: hypothetical protein A2076_02575 [Geobacteraceae bacterium GWC2_53_11]|nr:MAG: hypothetical protein A2076_02575 [Geobacteraceae bacterium GWC2_53_11]